LASGTKKSNQEIIMPRTLTGTFNSPKAARNAHEDFIDSGFPSEALFHARGSAELKVRASSDNEPEIREILGRHKPAKIEVNEAD
jgi:hypothetical protein